MTERLLWRPFEQLQGSNFSALLPLLFSFTQGCFSAQVISLVFTPSSWLWLIFKDFFFFLFFAHGSYTSSFSFFLPFKLSYCLSLKFTTCIILIMHQKESISDSPTGSHMLVIAVIKIISRLTWAKGFNFNCMRTKLVLAYYWFLFRKGNLNKLYLFISWFIECQNTLAQEP